MKLSSILGALALACATLGSPRAAFAQPKVSPANPLAVPPVSLCFGSLGALAQCVDASHPLPVTPAALAAGASTSANQTSELAKLDQLHADALTLATAAAQASTNGKLDALLAALQAATPAGGYNIGSTTGNGGWNDAASGSTVSANTDKDGAAHTPPVWAVFYQCRGYATQAGNLTVVETGPAGSAEVAATTVAVAQSTVGQTVPLRVLGATTVTHKCRWKMGGVGGTLFSMIDGYTVN